MRKVTLIFGLLSGAIISILMVIGIMLGENGLISFDFSELVGYGSMVIALSMIFFGIKSYRDNYQQGAIRFWKGFQVGILIALIASLMYGLTWEAYLLTRPAGSVPFIDKYSDFVINKMKEKGASSDKIDQKIKEMDRVKIMYQNPVMRFGMTIMEILPVGILITLISAALLRKKELLPAHHLERDIPRLET